MALRPQTITEPRTDTMNKHIILLTLPGLLLSLSCCQKRVLHTDGPAPGEVSGIHVSWDWSKLPQGAVSPAYLSLVVRAASGDPGAVGQTVPAGENYDLTGPDYALGAATLMAYYAEGSRLSVQGGSESPDTEALTFGSITDIGSAVVRMVVSERDGQPTVLQQPTPVYAGLSAAVHLSPADTGAVVLAPRMLGRRVELRLTVLSQSASVTRSECYLGGLSDGLRLADGKVLADAAAVRQWMPLVQSSETADGRYVSDGEMYLFGAAPSAVGDQAHMLECLLYPYQNPVPLRFSVNVTKLMRDERWDRMYLQVKYDLDQGMLLESRASLYAGYEVLIDM